MQDIQHLDNRVIVLDDDPDLRIMLQRYLTEQGFAVRAVSDVRQMQQLLARERFDVLVLDLTLPGTDGLHICRDMRATGEMIPILMLTARGDPVDRVIGLEMGADDYLSKPFDPRELAARLRALLRRQGIGGIGYSSHKSVHFGKWVLDLLSRKLSCEGQVIRLSSGECSMLIALASQPGRPLNRERLIALAYGADHDANDRSVDVQILRLRRLIEDDPVNPCYIQTVRGMGYVFTPDGIVR